MSMDLRGLVLAGGYSQRMGKDKGDLIYYDKPQKYYVADQLRSIGILTHISIRNNQIQEEDYQYLFDDQQNIGFIAGLLSAFNFEDSAWLCVGCDYPLLKTAHLKSLIEQRDQCKVATVIRDKNSGFLLPTIAIYEPDFKMILEENLLNKNYSLQRILKNENYKEIDVSDIAFTSIDTHNEYESIRKEINSPSKYH